jgi:hypothetical protein
MHPDDALGLSTGLDFRAVDRKGRCHIEENNSVDFVTTRRAFDDGLACVFCRRFAAFGSV